MNQKLKFFIFSVVLICCFSLPAQVIGSKFVPDSTYYREQGDYWISQFNHPYVYNNKYISGDTIIGNLLYQKFIKTTTTAFDTACKGASTLMHYNNRRLYINNKKVYDFNLVLSDTINIYYTNTPNHAAGYYTYTVTVCDSVYIGNKWRKQLALSGPITGVNIKWVEGLGDLYYGLAPDYTTAEMYKYLGGSYKLNCFSEHFLNTYGSVCGLNSTCNTLSIEKQSSITSDLTPIPNPADSYISFNSLAELEVSILNLEGKEIKSEKNTKKLLIGDIPEGVYFIRIKTSNNCIVSKLIILRNN